MINLPHLQGEGRGGDGVRTARNNPIPLLTSPLKGVERSWPQISSKQVQLCAQAGA